MFVCLHTRRSLRPSYRTLSDSFHHWLGHTFAKSTDSCERRLTWHRSVGGVEALPLYGAVSDKLNCQEVSSRHEESRDGSSTKCPNQREVHVVTIIYLSQMHTQDLNPFFSTHCAGRCKVHCWWKVVYFDVVVAARSGTLQLKWGEGQIDGPVYRHLDGPYTVHAGLIASIQVWVWWPKHAHWHWQIATTSLFRTYRKSKRPFIPFAFYPVLTHNQTYREFLRK